MRPDLLDLRNSEASLSGSRSDGEASHWPPKQTVVSSQCSVRRQISRVQFVSGENSRTCRELVRVSLSAAWRGGETLEQIAGNAPTTPEAEKTPSLQDIYLAARKKYDSR
jgi:hypothetical protein